MNEKSIPFHRPTLTGREMEYLQEAALSRSIVGDGPFSRRCAAFLENLFGFKKILMTPSCTSALEMSAMLCPIGPGDEVIMPSFTFVSTANAVALRGGVPVFVDIRSDTLNIDETLVEAAVTPKTKAISVVHYAGVGCEMDSIMAMALRHNLRVVEDAAQAVNATYRDRPLGSLGDFGCFSFHETKNFVAGEGGAIAINQSVDFERAEIVREKGTNRSKFLRGQVDKYSWIDIGSSFLPSDLACAFLLAQLEGMEAITSRREQVYRRYTEGLAHLAARGVLSLPVIPKECQSNYHLFHMVMARASIAGDLLKYLRSNGVGATFHYVPLHSSPVGRKFCGADFKLPKTEDLCERLVRLPLHAELSDVDVDRVIDLVTKFCETR